MKKNERMDRKTRHHRWLSRLFHCDYFGENVMKAIVPYIFFTVGIALLITCYATQPADERIKPNRTILQGQMK